MTMPCLPFALRIGREAPRIAQAGQQLSADRL
jgi:hypothetical protein